MTPIFLDTGYLIALEAADDQNHKAALTHWQGLPKPIPPLVTTSYILDEVVTFFNSRNRHAKAVDIGNRLLSSPSIQFVHVNESLFFEAWNLFKTREDKSYSVDRLYFVFGHEKA